MTEPIAARRDAAARYQPSLDWAPGANGPILDLIVNPTPAQFAAAVGTASDQPQGWRNRGACAEVDPEIFFPEKGGSTRAAKKVCAGCPVREQCQAFALETGERFGVWGGMSERERRILRADGHPDDGEPADGEVADDPPLDEVAAETTEENERSAA